VRVSDPTYRLSTGLVVVLVLALSGCSQRVLVRSETPGTVVLGDVEVGEVGPDGTEADVPYGFGDLAYSLEVEGVRTEGILPRTETAYPPIVAGCCLAACGVPTCAGCGVLAANPQLLSGALCVATTANLEVVYATLAFLCVAPTWPTSAGLCLGATAGLSPLLLLGATALPDEVTIPAPTPAPASAGSDGATSDVDPGAGVGPAPLPDEDAAAAPDGEMRF